MSLFCFNTASVLIQPPGGKQNMTVIKFQYSFCSYSTKMDKYMFFVLLGFNTASVLIQQAIRIIPLLILGFNTASILIQQKMRNEILQG